MLLSIQRPIAFSLVMALMAAHLPVMAFAKAPAQRSVAQMKSDVPDPLIVVGPEGMGAKPDPKAGCIVKTPVKMNPKTHKFDPTQYKPGEFVSLFVVKKSVKNATDDQEQRILCRELQSIELRFYLAQAESIEPGLYFEMLEHNPGKDDISYGEQTYKYHRANVAKAKGIAEDKVLPEDVDSPVQPYPVKVKLADGKEVVETRYGLNYTDYSITHEKLHMSYDQLYSKAGLFARKGTGWVAGIGGATLTYFTLRAIYKKLIKKGETVGIMKLVELIASKGTLMSRDGVKAGMATVFDVIILVGIYWQVGGRLKDAMEDLIDYLAHHEDKLQVDYLYKMLGTAFEHATYGKLPVSAAFDVEGNVKKFQDIDKQAKDDTAGALAVIQGDQETDELAEERIADEASQRRLAHLPSPEMKFSIKALKSLFGTWAKQDTGN